MKSILLLKSNSGQAQPPKLLATDEVQESQKSDQGSKPQSTAKVVRLMKN